MTTNRKKIYIVPADSTLEIMTGRRKITNIPTDAYLSSIYYSNERDAFMLVMEHPSFLCVREGNDMPIEYSETIKI